MPTKGPNHDKIQLIKEMLQRNPQGLWVREIARKTKLDKSLVSRYLSKYMKDEVENAFPLAHAKLVKLKKGASDV